ncbi:Membrane transporter [Trichostrongylus colubriformis]|uniref:Membrane transporter n=1 Tax=Trichostrongylus colubriformis TaxID=6319 RepID=A0AAN8G9Q7_TRICO
MQSKSPNAESTYGDSGDVTDWRSLAIASVISLFTAIQFTIYFSSLWPYLLQLDPNATESFFGWITAVYSLGQAIMCVGFGYWQNRIKQSRIPILGGLVLMFTGNFIYLLCGVTTLPPKWVMFISRSVTGLGAGMVTVLRTYAVSGSTVSDRSRSISLSSGSFALGLTIGPAIQIIFSPIGYPGFKLVGNLSLDMYTAPAFMGILVNLVCFMLVIFLFRESNVGLHKKVSMENEEHVRFFALPMYDRWALMICIMTRFAQMFVITNLETLGAPISLTVFGWNKQETVKYNSLMHGGFGFIGFLIYAISVYYDIGKMINHRIGACVGMLGLVAFHLITFPWWGLPGSIPYQQEVVSVNGSIVPNPDPVGCRPSFEWCATTPPINPVLFVVTYIVIVGTSFSLINVSMNTVFSTLIGPRSQGTMQGVLLLSGSVARMCGPIFVSNLFAAYGPRPAWGMEIAYAGVCALLWIIFYKRMVPLKLPSSFSAGEMFRNKHGLVYRF